MLLNGSFHYLDTFTLMPVADNSQTLLEQDKGNSLTLNKPLIFEHVLSNNIKLSCMDLH